MIKYPVDYIVKSALGNELHITEDILQNMILLEEDENRLLLKIENELHEILINTISEDAKSATITVNNRKITLSLSDDLDQLISKMGYDNSADSTGASIYSPMPGLVLKIMVKEGDIVKEGDEILVLEAMKMENLLQASAGGIVKKIQCASGDSVNKNDLLVEIE